MQINAIAVAAGTISLKKVIALLVPAKTLTLQKLTRKYRTTSPRAIARPGAVSSPRPWSACTYRDCAQVHGQELMY